MGKQSSLGEFEHLVMLAVLQLDDDARAIRIRQQLQERARRKVARGALYGTLARLHGKGFLSWRIEDTTPDRGGIPRRVFEVTDAGLQAIRASQAAISRLSEGLEDALGRR